MNVSAVCTVVWRGVAASGLLLGASAQAHDGTQPVRLAQANPCAIYGSGYVTVHGAGECAQIRGRVRLESDGGNGPTAAPGAHGLGYAPADPAPVDDVSRAHLRLPSAPAYPDAPRTR